MKIFTLKDARSEGYQVPFFRLTRAIAIRDIQSDLSNNKQMQNYAEDFAIYELGEWEPTNGMGKFHTEPVHVLNVEELVSKE